MSEDMDIKTSCKECVFAEWYEGTQNGCSLGRLQKFIDRGETTYPEPKDEAYYYLITRFCNTCRNGEWGNRFPVEQRIEQVAKESQVKYGILLIEATEENTDDIINWLTLSFNSILNQKLKPERVVVALSNPNIDKFKTSRFIKDFFRNTGIKAYISHIIDMQANEEEIVDICFSQFDNQFYSIFHNGCEIPNMFGASINDLINTDLKQIAMIEPYDGYNGATFLAMAHLVYKGNIGASLEVKIKDLAKSINKEELVCKRQTFHSLLS